MRTLFALVFAGLVLTACSGKNDNGAAAPTLAPGEACPTKQGRVVNPSFSPAIGKGPVYAVVGNEGVLDLAPAENFHSREWAGQKVLWVVESNYAGSVVIRGRRLDGPGIVRFNEGDVPPAAMRIGAGGVANADGWRNMPSYTRVQQPGCYAYLVDGDGFSYSIVFLARPITD